MKLDKNRINYVRLQFFCVLSKSDVLKLVLSRKIFEKTILEQLYTAYVCFEKANLNRPF